jgi:Tol biopolymer transport system component
MAVDPVWSPDGSWLAFGVVNTDEFIQKTIPALLNLQSCQVVPLVGIEGTLQGWVP